MQDIYQARFVYMAGRKDDYTPQHDYDAFYESKDQLLNILERYGFEKKGEWTWEKLIGDVVIGEGHAKWVCYITQYKIIDDLPEVVRLMLPAYSATTG